MAFSNHSIFPNQTSFFFTIALLLLSNCNFGYGDDISGQTVAQALRCFDNNFIYNGCDSAYRLNPSGDIKIPDEATNAYCNGPCLIETQLVLNCIDNAFDNFMFYNKATAHNLRDALRMGCSYSTQRGNFNPGWFMEGDSSYYSKANALHNWVEAYCYCLLLLIGVFYFSFYN